MSNNIAIRVDASALIGTGHFMRCLTLADALQKRGADICFISCHLPDHLEAMLISRGHSVKKLSPQREVDYPAETLYSHWLGRQQSTDAHDTLLALAGTVWQWLIVDHYALDARWETLIRPEVKHILVIDDMADRRHDCDMLLDQNFHLDIESRYSDKTPDQCRLLLGPAYALLREAFHDLRSHILPRTGPVKRLLVFFGGVDTDNCTQRTIQALAGIHLAGMETDIVIGAQHANRDSIEQDCLQLGFSCHVQTEKMAELMAGADLAIGAGGSASWERCCLGLPALLLVLADNQRSIAQGLDHLGAAILIGDATTSEAVISEKIQTIMDNTDLLQSLSKTAYSLVDGKGIQRVCEEMGH